MRVTLLHNPKAGKGSPTGEELTELIRAAGHTVRYQTTRKKKYPRALDAPADLIVVAGGDGTIRKVAVRLVRRGVPLTIIPLGTANNIATSLGICGTPAELIKGWTKARRRKLDVGLVRAPWGKTRFIEGMGCGLFTDVMAALKGREQQEPALFTQAYNPLGVALRALRDALADYNTFDVCAKLDGVDISGRYLMLEALNIRHVGPNLFLAPDADPGDGRLDFVLLTEEGREEFEQYLAYRLEGKQTAPHLTVVQGKRLRLRWEGYTFRLDDKLWPERPKQRKKKTPAQPKSPAEIEIKLKRRALDILIPEKQ